MIKVFSFILKTLQEIVKLFKSFVLDQEIGVTFYDFIIFLFFMAILIHVLNYLKGENEIENSRREYENRKRDRK